MTPAQARKAIANSEHINSKALEKALLEAEIKGLVVISPAALERHLNEAHSKLAELNKE